MRDPQGRIMKWFGTCTDIHDTVEALAVSRRAQERLQTTLIHAAVTLWAVDRGKSEIPPDLTRSDANLIRVKQT